MKKGEDKPRRINPNWKSYNGEPLQEGETLVPYLVDDLEYAVILGLIPNHMRIWTKAGIQFNVMFVPVPEEQAEIFRKEFNSSVNELLDQKLGRNRFSRCLVPQPDGSRKPCPKLKNGNHPPCATCPHRGNTSGRTGASSPWRS